MQKLGKYEILEEIGHGAMGVVYKARDPFIGRLVALKTINSNLVDRPDLLERFYQEAQAAGRLQHPNIVTIFELGQEKNTPFIAMQYLDGESLEKGIVRQTELPLAVKVGYVVRVCQALEYAHKNRVVHRDIKPGNIMVNSEGVVTVVDFGIARLVDFSRTHTNMMIGTPAYMAPELFRKKKADERTDIWAVGVTLYELICYQRPFSGDGYDIISSIMEDEHPPLSSITPECTGEVEAIIQRMLQKQAADRYQSMEDVLLDLEPVWNRLRSDAAKVLAQRAQEMYELGDLSRAQEMLRRARQIDNTNQTSKSLLERISAELRRNEVLPRVHEHLSRGRVLLQSRQFREAQGEGEAALSLDSHHEAAQQFAAEVQAAAARARQVEQKLRLAKQRFAEGALAEAESALGQALELDAENELALDLGRQIQEEKNRRERRKRLTQILQQARALWTELKYDECLSVLALGLSEFPSDPDLQKLQKTALADQEEQRKQLQFAEVRKFLGQQKLADARRSLDLLTKQYPQDSTVRNLQALVLQEEQEQRRRQHFEEEFLSLRSLVGAGKLQEALVKGDQLLRDFPHESEVSDLVLYVRAELAQQQQKRNEQEREKQIRGLLEAQRFQEAMDAARRAVQEFPKQDVFRRLAAEAEEKRKDQEKRERIQQETQQRVQEIRSKIKRQDWTEAIDLARLTLATLGPDGDVAELLQQALDLKRQFEDDQNRREKKKRLSDLLRIARTLWTEVKYGECLALIAQGLKEFPDEPELKKLQETARADLAEQTKQQRAAEVRKLLGQQKFPEARKSLEILAKDHPQDSTVINLQELLLQEEQEQRRKQRLEEELASLRALVTSGKLENAVRKGEVLLRDFPQEYEIKDLVTYARGEIAQQEQKRNEQEREKQIRGLLEARRFREAVDAARRSLQEFPKQDVFRRLAAEAEEKRKDQEEREKVQREIQQRVQEIRSKIKRQELTDAIDLAQQTLATRGPDTDLTQLLHSAVVEAAERDKKLEEQKQQLEAARSLAEKGEYAGATQILDQAIATRILQPSDPQAKQLLAQIAEQQEAQRQAELRRKKEEEREREERKKAEEAAKRKEAQKESKPEPRRPTSPVGEEKPPSARLASDPRKTSPPPMSTPTLGESATSIASTTPRPGSSVPVMTPLPTIAPQPKLIQTQIRIEEHLPAPPIVPPPVNPFRKPGVLALLGLVLLAIVSVGIYVYFYKPNAPKKPETVVDNSKGQRELYLQKESQDLRKQGRLDEALARDQEIVQDGGPLSPWAKADGESIEKLKQQENTLMAAAETADNKNDYKQAEKIYDQVIKLHGARGAEASTAKEAVKLRERGGSQEALAQGLFDRGTEAFKRRDYPAAEQFFQDALKQGPKNWGATAQAQGYVKRCETIKNQQGSLREAEAQFGAKQYGPARTRAGQAANFQDGDPDVRQSAQALLQRIQGRETQKKDFDDGTALLKNGQRDQAKTRLERVVKPANGDPDSDLSAKAAEEIKRIEEYKPPPPPTNYDSQLTKAETFVNQGQWDQADSILAGVPQSHPGYAGLKRKIADGRQEDQTFLQKKGAYDQAELTKNKEALRGLKPYFLEEAIKAERHGEDARNILNQIDADLKEPPKPPGGDDPAAIKALLERYSKAYDEGDLGALKAVRQFNAKDEKKLPDALKMNKVQGYSLQNCSNPEISGNTARISCDVVKTRVNDTKPYRTNLFLNRINGQWIIVSAN